MGAALKAIHDAFRRELALIRKEVAEAGPGVGAQLRINCLTVCQGLHHHHIIEDGTMFPTLGERHPELAQPLARLRAEHQTIARLLDDLQTLLVEGCRSRGSRGTAHRGGAADHRAGAPTQPVPATTDTTLRARSRLTMPSAS